MRADVSRSAARRRETRDRAERALAGLDERPLLVGFARRFATYKRADLVLRDVVRLGEVAARADRPIRFLFAGKAHPNDKDGLDLVRKVVDATRTDALLGKVFFLEDYDVALAKFLVQGVDVWLNTPLRLARGERHVGHEGGGERRAQPLRRATAGGTRRTTGRTASRSGSARTRRATTRTRRTARRSRSALDDEVAPLFFDRDEAGVPKRWLDRVKENLATVPSVFDAARMVAEYETIAYRPLASGSIRPA